MAELELRADCARCAALCCVTLAFDRSEWFAFDKASQVPCLHLLANHHCAIHATRPERGFSGCVQYDCYGAGQRVTEAFGGRSWREDAELGAAMFGAFEVLKHVHELLLLLREATRLQLSPADAARRTELERSLTPGSGWTPEHAANFDLAPASAAVHEFLRSLASSIPFALPGARRRLSLLAEVRQAERNGDR